MVEQACATFARGLVFMVTEALPDVIACIENAGGTAFRRDAIRGTTGPRQSAPGRRR
jgi:hypothetical protein